MDLYTFIHFHAQPPFIHFAHTSFLPSFEVPIAFIFTLIITRFERRERNDVRGGAVPLIRSRSSIHPNPLMLPSLISAPSIRGPNKVDSSTTKHLGPFLAKMGLERILGNVGAVHRRTIALGIDIERSIFIIKICKARDSIRRLVKST